MLRLICLCAPCRHIYTCVCCFLAPNLELQKYNANCCCVVSKPTVFIQVMFCVVPRRLQFEQRSRSNCCFASQPNRCMKVIVPFAPQRLKCAKTYPLVVFFWVLLDICGGHMLAHVICRAHMPFAWCGRACRLHMPPTCAADVCRPVWSAQKTTVVFATSAGVWCWMDPLLSWVDGLVSRSKTKSHRPRVRDIDLRVAWTTKVHMWLRAMVSFCRSARVSHFGIWNADHGSFGRVSSRPLSLVRGPARFCLRGGQVGCACSKVRSVVPCNQGNFVLADAALFGNKPNSVVLETNKFDLLPGLAPHDAVGENDFAFCQQSM